MPFLKSLKTFHCYYWWAKVSDKIKTIEKMMVMVDTLLIGGAMAHPFLKAKGASVGNSLCSSEDVALAKQLLSQDKGERFNYQKII